MRILLAGDYPNDPTLGSTKVFVKLQEEFRAAGHTCDVLLGEELGLRPRNPYVRRGYAPVLALRAVRRAFRRRGAYDIVDVTSAEGLWISLWAHYARRGARVAVISRSNGLEQLNYRRMLDDDDDGLLRKPWTRRLFHPLVRLSQVAGAARAADRLMVLNETDRAFAVARRWKPAARIDLVAHGVSDALVAQVPPAGQQRGKGILFCGSWDLTKGITYLAAAFERMVSSGVTANLTILGGGFPAEHILSSFSPAAQRQITVIDRGPEKMVMEAYRTHDVLVFPSTYEGFGMVLVEAMSQRLPVVATPAGCAASLVSDEVTGLRVPARDSNALAEALTRLLQDDDLRGRLAAAAFERVAGMTWRTTARETLAVYERALAGRAKAS
jgi:glycosyltransferase involved in cell wall biosynthesis